MRSPGEVGAIDNKISFAMFVAIGDHRKTKLHV